MRRARGFTLLEVLIALVIFALAAVVMGAAYVNVLFAYESVSRGNQAMEDVRFARAQLLAEPDREKALEGGDFEGSGGTRVRWTAAIEQTTTADLFRVEFTCEIAEAANQPSRPPIKETFFLLRPTWSQGLDTGQMRQEAKERILEMRPKLR